MVSPEGAGILQEHPAVITTGGVNMCPHVMPLSLPTRAGREKASKYLQHISRPVCKQLPGLVLGKQNSLDMVTYNMLNVLSCNQSAQWFECV